MLSNEADGEGGDSGDGEGDVVETRAPPPKNNPPPMAGEGTWAATLNCNKASTVPWLAQVFDKAGAPERPVFQGARHSHMTVL